MPARTKQLGLIMLGQAACVLVALWMGHRFTTASVQREAEQQAWADLEAGATEILSIAQASPGRSLEPPGHTWQNAETLSQATLPRGTRLLIVDPKWCVVRDSGKEHSADEPAPLSGQSIRWIPAQNRPGDRSSPSEVLRGTVDLPDGSYLAVAQELPDRPGHLLACLPETLIRSRTKALLASLPAISVVTVLWAVVLLAITVYMMLAPVFDRFDHQAALATEQSLHKAQELVCTRDAIIFGLAKLADSRDPDTGDHLERIAAYSTALASELSRCPEYRPQVTSTFVRLIGISSALHDIGKVGIEDRILLKPGPLSPEERARMQEHALIGGRCLREIEQRLGSSNFLQMAREIALAHHERWDSKGYPHGLQGPMIPLAARIVAVADVYDALATKRCYKDPLPHEECVAIIRDSAGTQFDPNLVDVWLRIESKFRDIARQYPGAEPPRVDAEEQMVEPKAGDKPDRQLVFSGSASQ